MKTQDASLPDLLDVRQLEALTEILELERRIAPSMVTCEVECNQETVVPL